MSFFLDDTKTAKIRSDLIDVHEYLSHTYTLIRIPKTGSESVSTALFDVLTPISGEDLDCSYRYRPSKDFLWWDHYSAIFCKQTLGDDTWNKAFNISVVRNPWARLYSLWKYAWCSNALRVDEGLEPDPSDAEVAKLSFEDWVMQGCVYPQFNHQHQKIVFPENSVTSQAGWLCDEDGNYIVDFISRLEEMDTVGIPAFKKLFGDRFALPEVKINATAHPGEYMSHYKPHMIQRVFEMCGDDIERFKYKFDGICEPGWVYLNE